MPLFRAFYKILEVLPGSSRKKSYYLAATIQLVAFGLFLTAVWLTDHLIGTCLGVIALGLTFWCGWIRGVAQSFLRMMSGKRQASLRSASTGEIVAVLFAHVGVLALSLYGIQETPFSVLPGFFALYCVKHVGSFYSMAHFQHRYDSRSNKALLREALKEPLN